MLAKMLFPAALSFLTVSVVCVEDDVHVKMKSPSISKLVIPVGTFLARRARFYSEVNRLVK